MQENLYQNIDIPQNNPLNNSLGENADTSPKKGFSLDMKNPKIVALVVLSSLIIVILIISLVVSLFRLLNQKDISPSTQTPTPTEIPTPTASNSLVPEIYQDKFKNIDNSFNNDLDLEPPTIDTEVGL